MSTNKNSKNNENSGFREGETWVINGWILDEKCHCLKQGEEIIHLEPKITRFIAYLAARAGEPISREQLLDEVWPGTVVSDESLTNAVNKIRKAFGDSSQNPQVIETIPKMGYRLVANVSQEKTKRETSGNHSAALAASDAATTGSHRWTGCWTRCSSAPPEPRGPGSGHVHCCSGRLGAIMRHVEYEP